MGLRYLPDKSMNLVLPGGKIWAMAFNLLFLNIKTLALILIQ